MQNIDLLVQNARIVSPKDGSVSPENTALAVDGGAVLDIGGMDSLAQKYQPKTLLNAENHYLFPGLINTHDHLFQVLTKGLGKECLLWDWLVGTIRQMTPFLNEEDIYYAAMAGLMENLQTGATTTLDFQYCHSHPGQFEAVCQAFQDLGMRGVVARPQFCNDYDGRSTVAMEDQRDYFAAVRRIAQDLPNRAMLDVGLIAPGMPGLFDAPGYSPGQFGRLAAFAKEEGLLYTAHLVETDDDDAYMLEKTGKTSIRFLAEEGFFSERCILAHCVKMSEEDYAIFKRWDVKVSHNPVSNAILASGIAPVRRFLQEGVCVSLGIDGSGSNDSQDMLETLKFACLLQKVNTLDACCVTALDTLQMATLGGTRALCRSDLGQVTVGSRADFFLYDPSRLKSAPVADPVASLVYCSGPGNIACTVVDGRIVYQNGRFAGADAGKVVEKLEACAARLRKAAKIDP